MSKIDNLVASLDKIHSSRRVYVLCDISPITRRLKATHYCCCLVMGRSPLWGIYNIDGKLMWFVEGREAIENHAVYNKKAWRVLHVQTVTGGEIGDALDSEELRKIVRRQKHVVLPR